MTDHVATLIARPGNGPDLAAALAAVRTAVADPKVAWLGEGEAVDIGFDAADERLIAGLRALVRGRPVDLVVQPTADRRKKLLVADMDSTMIAQECIDELADYAGFRTEVAALTERAMARRDRLRPGASRTRRAARRSDVETLAEVLAKRITPMPGARTLVATMRANGAVAVLVSGGFTDFAEPVAAMIGFEEVRANRLLARDGRLTGEVAEPVVGPQRQARRRSRRRRRALAYAGRDARGRRRRE